MVGRGVMAHGTDFVSIIARLSMMRGKPYRTRKQKPAQDRHAEDIVNQTSSMDYPVCGKIIF